MIMNLTIHMMLKNEEKYIRQTLESVLPYAERAIIIDTGSTDKTYDYAEEICNKYASNSDIILMQKPISKDSREWDGSHLNQELTDLRNEMLSMTETDWVWQVDGDEIYPYSSIEYLEVAMDGLAMSTALRGVMVPIKWCVSSEEYIHPGPFFQTLRVFPSTGLWRGEFPNEFLYVDNQAMTITDGRCIASVGPFLHMSMELHPERRPPTGTTNKLTDKEIKCLSI